jgi:hypothetical protein
MHAKLDNYSLSGREQWKSQCHRLSPPYSKSRWLLRVSDLNALAQAPLTSEYIVNTPIEQIREIVSKAATDSIEVAIPDEAKARP